MKKLLTLFALIAFNYTFAQAPQGINYQAVIRDASGIVISNSAVGINIAIRQGSPTGTVVYEETFAPTTNGFGLVNLVIGQGNIVSGSFNTIAWSNGPYFAEISADPTGGTSYALLGTQQLMSVPYALYADSTANYMETDPMFNGSVASGITATDTMNWNNDQVNDADSDPNNEIQTLSIGNDTIYLTNGGYAVQAMPVLENTGGRNEVCSGNTQGGTGWQIYNSATIYLNVNTSGCNFSSTPRYFTSIGGVGSHYLLTGTSAIYNPTATGFTIYVQRNDGTPLTPADAATGQWFVNWMAVGQ